MIRSSRCALAGGAVIAAAIWLSSCTSAESDAQASTDAPDLTGVWRNHGGPTIGGGQRGGWPEDAPYTDEAQRRIAEYRALVEGTGETPGSFCVGTGMPGSMLGSGGYPMEVIQRPEQITIIYEAHTELRRVYMGVDEIDRSELIPTRNGFSTGRWEGDTLVVETISLKEGVDQRSAHSAEARITERYRLDGESEDGRRLLTAEVTVFDPVFYGEPVTATKTWVEAEPDVRMLTYECTEPEWEEFLDQRREELGAASAG